MFTAEGRCDAVSGDTAVTALMVRSMIAHSDNSALIAPPTMPSLLVATGVGILVGTKTKLEPVFSSLEQFRRPWRTSFGFWVLSNGSAIRRLKGVRKFENKTHVSPMTFSSVVPGANEVLVSWF